MPIRKQLTLGLLMLIVLAVFTYMFPAKGEAHSDRLITASAELI